LTSRPAVPANAGSSTTARSRAVVSRPAAAIRAVAAASVVPPGARHRAAGGPV
jgi:hypothetical protein